MNKPIGFFFITHFFNGIVHTTMTLANKEQLIFIEQLNYTIQLKFYYSNIIFRMRVNI